MKMTYCRAALLLPFFITGCDQSAQDAARKEMQSLREEVGTLKQEVDKSASEAKTIRQERDAMRREAEARELRFNNDRRALQTELEKVTKAYEEYKAKFRMTSRRKATGQSLALLNCGGGKVYKDVRILGITPGEVRFQHADGSSKVALGRLDQGLRDRFGYDADEALAWQEEQDKALKQKQEQARNNEEQNRIISADSEVADTSSPKASYGSADRRRYQEALSAIYASARALQADNTGCPVHKRYQLASWSAEADRLKEKIAALPSAP